MRRVGGRGEERLEGELRKVGDRLGEVGKWRLVGRVGEIWRTVGGPEGDTQETSQSHRLNYQVMRSDTDGSSYTHLTPDTEAITYL